MYFSAKFDGSSTATSGEKLAAVSTVTDSGMIRHVALTGDEENGQGDLIFVIAHLCRQRTAHSAWKFWPNGRWQGTATYVQRLRQSSDLRKQRNMSDKAAMTLRTRASILSPDRC